MKPSITNKCINSYRIDAVRVISKILDRIPDKYLNGIGEVILLESNKDNSQRMLYRAADSENLAVLIINMAYDEYHKYPFLSIFSLNIDFLSKLNEHIRKYVSSNSADPEIINYPIGKINYRWTYFGKWTPLVYFINLFMYPFRKIILKLTKKNIMPK